MPTRRFRFPHDESVSVDGAQCRLYDQIVAQARNGRMKIDVNRRSGTDREMHIRASSREAWVLKVGITPAADRYEF